MLCSQDRVQDQRALCATQSTARTSAQKVSAETSQDTKERETRNRWDFLPATVPVVSLELAWGGGQHLWGLLRAGFLICTFSLNLKNLIRAGVPMVPILWMGRMRLREVGSPRLSTAE
jgi:hypothetical protein